MKKSVCNQIKDEESKLWHLMDHDIRTESIKIGAYAAVRMDVEYACGPRYSWQILKCMSFEFE